jgi:methionine biosynthesis protein MetW
MNIQLTNIIKNWIPDDSRVIDFGCGDGSLLKDLVDQKNVCGYGVEIDHKKIQECVMKGISVIEKDIDEGIQDFESSTFDVAIMASSIQCLKEPHIALRKMLNLSKQCIVTLPNLGFWKCRLDLAAGECLLRLICHPVGMKQKTYIYALLKILKNCVKVKDLLLMKDSF